jgi:hypothetical protein
MLFVSFDIFSRKLSSGLILYKNEEKSVFLTSVKNLIYESTFSLCFLPDIADLCEFLIPHNVTIPTDVPSR